MTAFPALDGVSVIIPVHNEELGLDGATAGVHAAVAKCGLPFEIIVVDDGSTDRTGATLAELAQRLPGLVAIRHAHRAGYGGAIKSGLRRARYDTILICDGDMTYPPEAIPDLLKLMREHAMAVGARVGERARIPWVRRPAKRFLTWLAEYLTDQEIPDLNSGLRAIRKKVVERFLPLLPDGFSFTTTITLVMLTNGYPVAYLAIDYRERLGRSKIRPVRDVLNFLQLIIRVSMYFNPLKVFLPASLVCLVSGFSMAVLSFALFGRVNSTSVILSVTGVQLLAIGMLADLIDKRGRL